MTVIKAPCGGSGQAGYRFRNITITRRIAGFAVVPCVNPRVYLHCKRNVAILGAVLHTWHACQAMQEKYRDKPGMTYKQMDGRSMELPDANFNAVIDKAGNLKRRHCGWLFPSEGLLGFRPLWRRINTQCAEDIDRGFQSGLAANVARSNQTDSSRSVKQLRSCSQTVSTFVSPMDSHPTD